MILDPLTVQLIIAALTFLTALMGVVLGIINKQEISVLHTSVNSKMDTLLEQKGLASKAEGVVEGRAQMTSEQAIKGMKK
jgi:hypothetical protein